MAGNLELGIAMPEPTVGVKTIHNGVFFFYILTLTELFMRRYIFQNMQTLNEIIYPDMHFNILRDGNMIGNKLLT